MAMHVGHVGKTSKSTGAFQLKTGMDFAPVAPCFLSVGIIKTIWYFIFNNIKMLDVMGL